LALRKMLTQSAFFIAIAMVGLATSGCKGPNETIWSAQSKSPDNKLVAMARTENVDGPGINAQWTAVSLRQNFDSAKAIEVLTIDEDSVAVRNLKMNWISPWHLDISYDGGDRIIFQAIKCLGVDVTVQGSSYSNRAGTN